MNTSSQLAGPPCPSCAAEDLDRPLPSEVRLRGTRRRKQLELIVADSVVSCLSILDLQQQLGPGTAQVGGIAGVNTDPAHRDRGYARRLLQGALTWMRHEGYALSMLHGIPGLYHKFGYAQAFPDVNCQLATAAIAAPPAPASMFTDFTPDHAAQLLRLYHRGNRGRTGIIRRRSWRGFHKGITWQSTAVCRLLFAAGKLTAYVVFDSDRLSPTVLEAGCADADGCPAILRECRRWAAGRETICFRLPADHPLMIWSRPFGLTSQMHYRRDGGAMVRLINVTAALQQALPLLAPRTALMRPGSLLLRTNLGDARLSWHGLDLTVSPPTPRSPAVDLPQWALAQLIYGAADVATMAATGTVRGSSAAVGALSSIFPAQPHFAHLTDEF